MSKSQPILENPCKKWIEYKAEEGKFYYFDKAIGEKGKNIEVPTPVCFCVIDELSVITGFSKKHDSQITSNEVHSVKNETLRVRTFKGGESVIGLYSDIRDNIVAMGGKFTKSVYALLIHDDFTTEFVNFKFRGAAFSAWLDKKFNAMNFIVGVQEFVEEKNGNNTYQVPVFKAFKSNPEIDAAAIEQDKILQEYLRVYKARIPEKEIEQAVVEEHKEEFVANPIWQGKSKPALPQTKEELIADLKNIANPPKGGKQIVTSTTDPAELTRMTRSEKPESHEYEATNIDDLPF